MKSAIKTFGTGDTNKFGAANPKTANLPRPAESSTPKDGFKPNAGATPVKPTPTGTGG